jgi:hypothetical protein
MRILVNENSSKRDFSEREKEKLINFLTIRDLSLKDTWRKHGE